MTEGASLALAQAMVGEQAACAPVPRGTVLSRDHKGVGSQLPLGAELHKTSSCSCCTKPGSPEPRLLWLGD